MATKTRISLEEFLAMPETEPPSELIDGEVVQKVAPNIYHAMLTARLITLLGQYLEGHREAFVVNELRHVEFGEQRVYLPDISVFAIADRRRVLAAATERPVDVPPLFAIEVLSPGVSFGRIAERAAFFMRNGTQLLWLVDPDSETITVYRPGQEPVLRRAPGKLDAKPVLASFGVDLAELFASLHEDEGRP